MIKLLIKWCWEKIRLIASRRGRLDISQGTNKKKKGGPLRKKEYWVTFAKSGITLCIYSKFALPKTKLKFEQVLGIQKTLGMFQDHIQSLEMLIHILKLISIDLGFSKNLLN